MYQCADKYTEKIDSSFNLLEYKQALLNLYAFGQDKKQLIQFFKCCISIFFLFVMLF